MTDSQPPTSTRRTDRVYLEAKSPDGTVTEVAVTLRRLSAEAKKGKHAVLEAGKVMPEILRNPKAIFEGIRWDKDEDRASDADGWRCYCGIPTHSYSPDGHAQSPWQDEVYLVFVNAEGVVYNWRWEACDSDNTTVPDQYGSRFCKQVWP